ncbi:hypothetical protein [Oceanobacillus kapialis]|uniref:Uncharacterized protein n=1 Tax=Oceanobacillus kapialis TaxID=481353 RepID=A0ABW5PVT9_9BACI
MIYLTLVTALITLIFNTIFHWLKNKFDWFTDKKKFQREYFYSQLRELYLPLYAIVAQSEYLRKFHHLDHIPFNEIPFVEIKKERTSSRFDMKNGKFEREKVDIEDVITEFNKEEIIKRVIDKSEFASQELLKLAVAYRYVHKHYQDETIIKEQLDKYQTQELELIKRIVKKIVHETNYKLKFCHMEYNKDELKKSIMLYDINNNLK